MIAGLAFGLFASPSVAFIVLDTLTPADVQAREKQAVLAQDKCSDTASFSAMNRLQPGLVSPISIPGRIFWRTRAMKPSRRPITGSASRSTTR